MSEDKKGLFEKYFGMDADKIDKDQKEHYRFALKTQVKKAVMNARQDLSENKLTVNHCFRQLSHGNFNIQEYADLKSSIRAHEDLIEELSDLYMLLFGEVCSID